MSFDVGRDVYTGIHKNLARFLPPLDSSTRPGRTRKGFSLGSARGPAHISTFQAAYLGICSSAGRASYSVNLANNYFHGRSVRRSSSSYIFSFGGRGMRTPAKDDDLVSYSIYYSYFQPDGRTDSSAEWLKAVALAFRLMIIGSIGNSF